jgi:CheY-like chemotaxis protein
VLFNNENRARVLVLEDEPIIGRATCRTLISEGFDVDVALDGLIAKDKIESESQYEFLIFDIRTPGINGIQLYEYLELEHPELTTRVIFTTGDCMGETTKIFLEKVNRPFLSKPYTPTQLRELIRSLLSAGVSQS